MKTLAAPLDTTLHHSHNLMDNGQVRRMENDLVTALALLEWIQTVLDGKEVSDFALSFPIVREVSDLKHLAEER